MKQITKSEWNKIPNDYKGIYHDYQGHFPQYEGRRDWLTMDETGATVLLIEGAGFEIIED